MNKLEFFRLRSIGIKILEQSDTAAIFSSISEIDFIHLAFFPSRKVQKRAFLLLKSCNPSRFSHLSKKNLIFHLNEGELLKIRRFQVFFLIDTEFKFYYRTYTNLVKAKQNYLSVLIEGLGHSEEALQINCMNFLIKHFSPEYRGDTLHEFIFNLKKSDKDILLQKLRKRLTRLDLSWYEKEDIIHKMGDLGEISAVFLIQPFLHDPNVDVRNALAYALRFLKSSDSVRILYQLLLDEKDIVRTSASESLGKLLPGLYLHKTSLDILNMIEPEELIRLMGNLADFEKLSRVWAKMGYDSKIIAKALESPVDPLLKSYFSAIISAASQNIVNSIYLVIKSRVAQILPYLDNLLESQRFHQFSKSQIVTLMHKLHTFYTIKNRKGLEILL